MTDSSGAVVWAADYKPFGEATVTVSTITNNLRFLGQYYDVETGLHYNYFRDYDPTIGKYKQADPIGLLGGINPYAYVLNNALRFADPDGLEPRTNLDGDDPGLSLSPEEKERLIRELEEQLKNNCLSQKEKEKIRRRIEQLRRRPSKRQQHHFSPPPDIATRNLTIMIITTTIIILLLPLGA